MNLASPTFYDENKKHLNLWWQGILVASVFMTINIPLALFDNRLLADEALWIKPLKFQISMIIHFFTLVVLASLLSSDRRNSIAWKSMTYAVVTAGLFEVMYIFLQAARVRESHFNKSTLIESAMYGLMGVGAVILVAGSFYLGYLLYQDYKSEYSSKKSKPLLLSAALGLTFGSVLTLIIAGHLSSSESGFVVNEATKDALRFPIFSWYLNGQDFRIPHFFATHMMQIFPLYGLWLTRNKVSIADAKTRLFRNAGIYSLLVLLLFAVALF